MSKISEIIKDLIASDDQWHERTLARGLKIHIRLDGDFYVLLLSRTDTHPSDQEWKIVIKSWAYPAGNPAFEKGCKNRRFYLKGKIQKQEIMAGVE